MDNENIEERLYSLVHHESSKNFNNESVQEVLDSSSQTPAPRVVSSKSVINNSEVNKQSSKRYWVNNEKPGNYKGPKFNPISQIPLAEKSDTSSPAAAPPKFVPYSSILSGLNVNANNLKDTGKSKQKQKKSPNFEKNKKSQKTKFPKTKLLNPLSKGGMMKLKNLHKVKVEQQQQQQQKEKGNAAKKNQSPHNAIVIDSSSENDEVIAIEVPPPPTINLDSSDESVVSKKEFTLPKSVRQLKSVGVLSMNSPRPISPSSNSMMSDDFIVTPDKTRLTENYAESDTQNVESPKNSYGESSKSSKSANKTLEELKSQMLKPCSTESSSGQNTDRSSCEKEKIQGKKQEEAAQIVKKLSKEQDSIEDSVYGAKAKKRADVGTRKRSISTKPSEESSSDAENPTVVAKKPKMRRRKSAGGRSSGKNTGDSESETEIEPKHKLFASTPKEAKKKPKKRQKFNSERYEDNDFNTLLSTIVQDDDREENSDDEMEDSELSEKEQSVKDIRDSESFVTIDEVGESDEESIQEVKNPVVSVIEIEDSNISPTKTSITIDDSELGDCTIIEKPIETITVDDESPYISSTGEKIIIPRKWKQQLPDDCDLMLNIRKSNFEPHEYIRDYDPNKPRKQRTHEDIAQELSRSDAGWNEEMKIFYNESWGGETFNVTQVLSNMPRDRNIWKIDRSDFYRPPTDMRIKCHNCNEYGHMKAKCKRPRKRIVCIMCGEDGHRETRCPNTICLLCGKPNKIFSQGCVNCVKFQKKICPLCNVKGHDVTLCPDKWRRYHSTTTETMNLNSEVTYNTDRIYCCICAKKGHWAEQCKSSEKVVTGSLLPGTYEVKSHKPIYPVKLNFEDEPLDNQQVFSMFSYFENYEFDYESLKNPGGYYSRIEVLNKRKEVMMQEEAKKKETKAAKKKRKRRNGKSGDKSFRMQESFTFENSPPQEIHGSSSENVRKSFNFSEEIRKIEDSSFELNFLKAAGAGPTNTNVATDETLKITLNTRNNGRFVNVKGRDSPYNFTEYFEDPNSVGKFVRNPDTSRIAYEIQELENTGGSPKHLDTSDILPYPAQFRKSPLTVGPGQHENFGKSSPVCGNQEFDKLEVVVNNSEVSGRFVKHQEVGSGHKLNENLAKRLEPAKPQSKILEESLEKSSDISFNTAQIPITEFNTTPGITPGPSQVNSDDELSPDKRDLFSQKVLPDYISLGGDDEAPNDNSKINDSREYAAEEVSNSRVLLQKNHLKILFNSIGRKFIEEVEKKYEVGLEFGSDNFGDHLTVTGYLSNQQLFQQELKDFLYKIESEEFEKHQINSTQVPKERSKLITLIEQHLKNLSKRHGTPEKIYEELLKSEKDFDYKKVMKSRRALNLVLLGQKGMGDGKIHLSALKVILAGLLSDNSADQQIEKELRDTISEHMLYIFSSKKHNYQDLMEEYVNQKKPKMLPNPASMIRDQNNKMMSLPNAPPPPNWNNCVKPQAVQGVALKNALPPPPKWYPQTTTTNNSPRAKRLLDMVKSSRAMLSKIHHSYETDSVYGLLHEYQEKIQNGQITQGISKKLKRIQKVLQEKVQEVGNT